ncbi:MAG: Hsp20/alpha crystallin family protein [Verrucomicrobiaceae bacterium]|nr:Hsp20/alpha crystallin family protein [Verrucomicrobiaceae bacterium]
MKLTRFSPSSLGRVTDFDDWFRNPFTAFPSLGQFFGSLPEFISAGGTGRLLADIHEDKDNYFAQFEVPGVKKEDVKIELNNQLLTVTVEKKEKTAEGEQSSTLTRSVSVPDGVKADAITARLEHGVLSVTLPKAEHRKPKTIEIA